MTEEELQRLRSLRDVYNRSLGVCDPIEYVARQRMLLHQIAFTLLVPLEEYEESLKNGMD